MTFTCEQVPHLFTFIGLVIIYLRSPTFCFHMQAFDALLKSLDSRGIRESHLRVMLLKIEKHFKDNVRRPLQSASQNRNPIKNEIMKMGDGSDDRAFSSPSSIVSDMNHDVSEASSSFRIEIGRNHFEKGASLRRYQDFLKWVSGECFNSILICAMRIGKTRCNPLLRICDSCLGTYFCEEKHCLSCHVTFADNLDFPHHVMKCEDRTKSDLKDCHVLTSSVPLGISLLKALLAYIEVKRFHQDFSIMINVLIIPPFIPIILRASW